MSKREQPAPSTRQASGLPNCSALTYGFVGFSLAAVILLAVAGFYHISLPRHGLAFAGVTSLAFVGGIAAHAIRTVRYRALRS
ncbi:hypothetical protein NIM87_17955 [Devosia sp. XJ19-1]|uniref:hypothetical protein n=1 Tax=Devosia ureilytica TaxID=2952754 RepID=UPI0020C78800|nr:hypothetical protein [Devosia ureilytica]MCP8885397.1 hypothetical protein [Devosia ureilytica]